MIFVAQSAVLVGDVTVEEGAEIGFDPDDDAKRGFVVSSRGVTVVPRGTIVKKG